jgi:hypothetical protein
VDDLNSLPGFRADCPCTKKKCQRHGLCIECHGYHSEGKHLPYCLRKDIPGDFAWGSFTRPEPRKKKRR